MFAHGVGYSLAAATQLPRLSELSIDFVTVAFAVGVSLILTFVFSVLSTRLLNYNQLKDQLQSSGKGSGLQINPRSRNALVIVQVTLTSLMLIGTSTLMKQSLNTINHPLGFDHQDVLTFQLELGNKYPENEEQEALLDTIAREIKTLPAVDDVYDYYDPIRMGNFGMSMRDEMNKIGAFKSIE